MRVAGIRRPAPIPGGALRRQPPGRPPVPPSPAACRARLGIAYQITDGQLRGTVEMACHTKTTQASTILLWAGRLDGVSRRLLLEALRTAARHGPCARLHVFAAAARDLFRHVSKTLPSHPGRCAQCPPQPLTPDAGAASLPGDLLAAARDLRHQAPRPPRAAVTYRPRRDWRVSEALSALHELFASVGRYLEQALRPLRPHFSRKAARRLIQETRHELDHLAACCTDADVYVEDLSESGDDAIAVEVEASLSAPAP